MRIKVRVITRSKRQSVDSLPGSKEYRVRLSSIPERGKANEELIRILSRYFKVPQAGITIISGKSSRTKLVDVAFRDTK